MIQSRLVRGSDPYLTGAIANREAVLWVGLSFPRFLEGEDLEFALQTALLKRWAAVFVDADKLPVARIVENNPQVDDLALRYIDTEPQGNLPGNRLPIYGLRGPRGTVGPNAGMDDLEGMLGRINMLRQIPPDLEMIVIGATTPPDLIGLIEASKAAPHLRRLTIIAPEDLNLEALAALNLDRLTHWVANWADFQKLLERAESEFSREVTSVRVRSNAKETDWKSIDLSRSIDKSYPITQAFDLICVNSFLKDRSLSEDDIKGFFEDPTRSWLPYAEGLPYPRHRPFRDSLRKYLKRFGREGQAASCTMWLTADDGSGVTTALRHICFEIAREGFPVLVARRDTAEFDFSQLIAFLTHAADRMVEEGVAVPEVPWVIAFDAEHVELHWEFVFGVCNGLKNLLRSVVILAVRASQMVRGDSRLKALGANRNLGGDDHWLANTITVDESVALGEHFQKFIPQTNRISRSDWERYISDTIRLTTEDRRSLFWVALRFWLLRMPAADETLRGWLARTFTDLVADRATAYRGLLEVAAMAAYRLIVPTSLLQIGDAEVLLPIARDQSNALGLRLVRHSQGLGVTYSHPQVAEEILRIAMGDPKALAAVEIDVCTSLLDLELHLLSRLVRRPAAGNPECVPVIEDMVTTALRVDPHEAARNYFVRYQIVALLEQAPDPLWDASQLFNHHLAKARRHIAADPPSADWTIDARREQLHLAEQHLIDALDYIRPVDKEREESKLNLRVSLGLTCDVRARLEEEDNQPVAAAEYRLKGEEQYTLCMGLDADNSYVLENFARFKLRLAEKAPRSTERARMIVEAIAMLEWQRISNPNGRREEPITTELARAFSLLEENGGRRYLFELTRQGNEVAWVALARLELAKEDAKSTDRIEENAEHYLRQVKPELATWRSKVPLYRIVSRRVPHDFIQRLELLRDLGLSKEFNWPLQLLLDYGILLFQVGDPEKRKEGELTFHTIRNALRNRSGEAQVSRELRFLRTPKSGFKDRLETSIVVRDTSNPGKNFYGIPLGWQTISIPFRPHRFGRDQIRVGNELDCYIQFTNFGPQAVPRTEGEE